MKKIASVAAAAAAVATSAPAFAQAAGTGGPDFSALTGAIDMSSTSTAILSVGAVAIGVSLAVLGVRKVIGIVRGA